MKNRYPFSNFGIFLFLSAFLCGLTLPQFSFAALTLIQKSEPAGVITQSTHYYDFNETVLTRSVPEKTGGYVFTHWTINGNRTDIQGPSVSLQVESTITENTMAIAHYSASNLDSDMDGIPDWFEIRTNGTLLTPNQSDDDNDSFLLDQEFWFGLNPKGSDYVEEGGISIRRSKKIFVNLGGARELNVRSDPPGLVSTQSSFPEVNSTFVSPSLNGKQGGFYFSHWEVNGVRQSDPIGKGLSKVTEVMNADKEVVARFIEQNLDEDNDQIPDWYEWHEFGTLENDQLSNPDEDSFPLIDEIRFGLSGNLRDTIVEGGISIRRSRLTSVNLGGGGFVKVQSDPPGMIASSNVLQEVNSTYESPNLNGKVGSYVFTHWEVNGLRKTNSLGMGISRVTKKINEDLSIIAKYEHENSDTDEDGIPDWYEIKHFGALESNQSSDFDQDGFTNQKEIAFGQNPLLHDTIVEGGIAMRRSRTIAYVKDLSDSSNSFDTDGDGLSDKQENELGSNATLVDTDGDGYSDKDEFVAGSNLLDSKSFPNQSPTTIYLSENEILEGEEKGSAIGFFAVSDPNPNSTHHLELTDQNETSGNRFFTIDENKTLKTNYIFDYEKNSTFEIKVRAIDEGNLSVEKSFTIRVSNRIEDIDKDGIEDAFDPDIDGDGFSNDRETAHGSNPNDAKSVPNSPPTQIILSDTNIPENLPIGSVVGNFIGFDPDPDSSLSYLLVDGNGSANNWQFDLDKNGTLSTNFTFDFESQSSVTLRVRLSDDFNESLEKAFRIQVVDVFEEKYDKLPLVKTQKAIETDNSGIRLEGEIIRTGDFKIREVGFVLHNAESNQSRRLVADFNQKNMKFGTMMNDFTFGKNNHFQAYAKTEYGTSYGSIKTFQLDYKDQKGLWWEALSAFTVDGWIMESWMGSLLPYENQWAFHQRLEWIYLHGDGKNGFWIWKENFGWLWSNPSSWPFMWSHQSSTWYYLLPQNSSYLLYDYSTETLR